MDVYWFGFLVYLNPIIWMILYNHKIFNPKWIYPIGAVTIIALIVTGWSSAHYTNNLLISYILMVMYATYYYRFRPGFQPVCLAFLIIFLNSFFWEFPIHVADFLEFDNFGVIALQSVHLLPLPFLLSAGMKLRHRWWYTSCWAWFVILGFTYLRMEQLMPYPADVVSLYLSRFIGLATLLFILRFPEQGESKVIIKLRGILNHEPW